MMGGTFDRLHEAHKELLRTAAHMADEMFVGVVGDELGEKFFPKKELGDMIEPYTIRTEAVQNYVGGLDVEAEVSELTDSWGPAPHDPEADLIVVSQETIDNAKRINQMRGKQGLVPLDIVVIPWIFDEGELLSSTLLRKREAKRTDKEG